MTRIIAGSAKGQRLDVPERGTRPTSDRVREACFSALESWLHSRQLSWEEVNFVDLFGGSGAIGLEAASRGATHVTIVENNSSAVRLIRSNIHRLGLSVTVTTEDVTRWAPDFLVDIIYVDPPYSVPDSEIRLLLDRLSRHPSCVNSLVVIERGNKSSNPFHDVSPEILVDSWDRTYGDTKLWYGHLVGGSS